ncbi:Mevalonate kinase [uncultured archaeon]|nr:Mevalonate kinase [uncultured archaeon]
MGNGEGYGKVILFGEHFVVHGVPSIVSAIGDTTTCEVIRKQTPGWTLKDDRPATPGYKTEKLDQQKDSINRVLTAAGIDPTKTGINITFAGNLLAASGVGASAASCTALARALSDEFKLKLNDEKINEIAYEGEKGYHGTPSGIDNTAATYGGLIWFVKGSPNVMDRIKTKKPVEIVMGNTGKVADTKAAVAGVKERKDKFPGKYTMIFNEAGEVAGKARTAFEAGDMKEVGALMDRAHELLKLIEVSSNELDFLVSLAKSNGAWGAKMTGGGLGGYMVALTPGKKLQNTVAAAIEAEGFQVLKTTIGV